jgi:hypothetical protein
MVFQKELPATANEYSDAALLTAFKDAEALEDREIRERLEARWGGPEVRRRTWAKALGPAKFTLVRIRGLRDAAAQACKGLLGMSEPTVEIGTRT